MDKLALVGQRRALELDEARMPIVIKDYGNTVSSTIPILIRDLRDNDRLQPGMHNMLIGFGVGWSWAGCMWNETWSVGGTRA